MFHNLLSIGLAALAVFALLAVWLAVELPRRVAAKPTPFVPARKLAGPAAYFAAYLHGVRLALRSGPAFALRVLLIPTNGVRLSLMPMIAGADGATDVIDEIDGLSDGEKKELKELGEATEEMRTKLVGRIAEMKGQEGADKEEVERREKELGEKVDKILGLAEKSKSTERSDFEAELAEKLEQFEAQMKDFGRQPVSGARGVTSKARKAEDKYPGENLFLDMKEVARGHGGAREKAEALAAYEEKFNSPERLKAWAAGDLEEVDLILPDIQQALPFLRAQAKVVQLFREIRTSSPSVEFPVFKSGLQVDHVADAQPKPESEPEFDLEVARVFTIAGISDVPNPTLEDFPAARGWIATELGAATGVQEELDVLVGTGEGEPLGLYENEDIPTRPIDVNAKASLGRLIITSAFRAAQQVRIKGFMEPTDVILNPAAWTDVVLAFEDNIGFLYGPPQMESTGGPPIDTPPARVLGLPVTWSSYIPAAEGGGNDETSLVVGNFNDGIVLRRSPFRIDVDTSVGFKKNLTSFRGEERMGFIVVRPKSFVRVTGVKPSAVE